MNLPDDLRLALDNELPLIPPGRLALATRRLSEGYRTGAARVRTLLSTEDDVAAYAAYRLPGTFAAVLAGLIEAGRRRPNWSPRTVLDVGAGPGTAGWAAAMVWPPLSEITRLERDSGMISFGRRLASHALSPAVRGGKWVHADLLSPPSAGSHDLVIASYVLGEIPQERLDEMVDRLWGSTADTMLLVEPGTPTGFAVVRSVRDRLRSMGAFITAPCPHQGACPMVGNDWCHFAQRVSRSRRHRDVKGGSLSYEDEKFSYVALSRLPADTVTARVIRHPRVRPGRVDLELCTPQGLEHSVVTRRDRDAFRNARGLRWGSGTETEVVQGAEERDTLRKRP